MQTKSITIPENGYNLSGTFITPDDTSQELPAVVFYHGMASQSKPRYNKRAQFLAEKGIAALTFDFRGCGESDGKLDELTIADWFADAILAFDYLTHQPFVDQNRIGISGKSFGGYIAALVCQKRKAKSMVLHAPAVYPDAWFDKPYQITDDTKKQRLIYRNSKDALNNTAIAAIKQYQNPILVIGSEFDDTCPRNIVEGYYTSAASKEKKIVWIKDADHRLSKETWNQEYIRLMIGWFTKTL